MWTLIPLFWTSGDVLPGFQSQSWQHYSHLAEAYVLLFHRLIKNTTYMDFILLQFNVRVFQK